MSFVNSGLYPTHIALTYKTSSEWTSLNPVLIAGEVGIESDTLRMKCGDGTSLWSGLPYMDAGIQTAIENQAQRIEQLEELAEAIMEVTSSIMDNIMKGEVSA